MVENQKPGNFRPVRSITRLLIGGILLGSELLENQLQKWDGNGDEADSEMMDGKSKTALQENPLPDTLPAPQVGMPPQGNKSDVRYALIGLIFEGEDKLDEALVSAKRIGDRASRLLNPLFRPIQKLGVDRPVRKGFDQLTRRSQSAVDRWISRGREEDSHSRELTQKAATSTVDQSIHYMAENEAITELIQTQGVSLAEQILELVRSISVSADYFFEGLLRYLFRRRPRYLLPPPSQDVQDEATWKVQDFRREDL